MSKPLPPRCRRCWHDDQRKRLAARAPRSGCRDRADLQLNSINGKLSIPPALQDRLTISTHGALLEYGEPDQLYLNDGAGHFTPVSRPSAWRPGYMERLTYKDLQL